MSYNGPKLMASCPSTTACWLGAV